MWQEEAKKPVDRPKAVEPFVVGKKTSSRLNTSSRVNANKSTLSNSFQAAQTLPVNDLAARLASSLALRTQWKK